MIGKTRAGEPLGATTKHQGTSIRAGDRRHERLLRRSRAATKAEISPVALGAANPGRCCHMIRCVPYSPANGADARWFAGSRAGSTRIVNRRDSVNTRTQRMINQIGKTTINQRLNVPLRNRKIATG